MSKSDDATTSEQRTADQSAEFIAQNRAAFWVRSGGGETVHVPAIESCREDPMPICHWRFEVDDWQVVEPDAVTDPQTIDSFCLDILRRAKHDGRLCSRYPVDGGRT